MLSDVDDYERGGATSSVWRGESVGEPVGPRCPVRCLLLEVALCRRLGIASVAVIAVKSSRDEEKKDDFILLLLSTSQQTGHVDC